MITPRLLDSTQSREDEQSSFGTRIAVGLVCALLLSATVFGGYMYLRKRHARDTAARVLAETPPAKPIVPAKAQIFVDDAMPKGSQTLIGGTVENISGEQLSGLSVEVELRKRKDGATDIKEISLDPRDLAPGQKGRYSFAIVSQDYSSARVLGLKSSSLLAQVPFKTLPGAERPLEKTPDGKTIVVGRPRGRGEEFLNTPDNPTRVP
ncbi:MAG: hypothetical protein ABI596_10885 [Pyrinomonadaceae bacterium]